MTLPLSPGPALPVLRGALRDDAAAGECRPALRPVTFDLEYFSGRPRHLTRAQQTGATTSGSIHGDSANVTLSEPEISSGTWLLEPRRDRSVPEHGGADGHGERELSAR